MIKNNFKSISRKKFLKQVSIITLGFASFTKLAAAEFLKETKKKSILKLIKDPNGIISLPPNFSYTVISMHKDLMSDGLLVPNAADGMACFKGQNDSVILIRNHELGHLPKMGKMFTQNSQFGKSFPDYFKLNKNILFKW